MNNIALVQICIKKTCTPHYWHSFSSAHLSSNGLSQFLDIYKNVQYGLADVGVKFNHRVTKLLHILSQQLVGIADSVIQVTHLVICETPEIQTHLMS